MRGGHCGAWEQTTLSARGKGRRGLLACALALGDTLGPQLVGCDILTATCHASVCCCLANCCLPNCRCCCCCHQVHYGWNGYFTAMIGACVVSLALMLPLANAKSYVQLQGESKPAAA